MGGLTTLVNTESRKIRRDFALWTALPAATRPAFADPPAPHWCHIPPALFASGERPVVTVRISVTLWASALTRRSWRGIVLVACC